LLFNVKVTTLTGKFLLAKLVQPFESQLTVVFVGEHWHNLLSQTSSVQLKSTIEIN